MVDRVYFVKSILHRALIGSLFTSVICGGVLSKLYLLPSFTVIDKLFLYVKKWRRPGVFVPLRALPLVLVTLCLVKCKLFQVAVFV